MDAAPMRSLSLVECSSSCKPLAHVLEQQQGLLAREGTKGVLPFLLENSAEH
jgi:hypothetical protein